MVCNFSGEKNPRTTEISEAVKKENALLNKAIIFAAEHHAGAVRKISTRPYILHPLETMQILFSMNADMVLMTAGVLHDTVEDTDATIEEIIDLFGEEIGALVNAHSEDKSLTWSERKQHAIDELIDAPMNLKMLVMADKVSNLRSIASNCKTMGDKLWDSFNAPKDRQAWYYSSILNALHDLQNHPETEAVYREMVQLYNDIFVL